ncbi:MAG TPA: hypothetical protein VLG40_00040 [Candidatus Saccharimonas sp.]|nr:hypothetical protein [Candidatus Saccharimonas sp.]
MSSDEGRREVQVAIDILQGVIRDGKMGFGDVLGTLAQALNISHIASWEAARLMFVDAQSIGEAMLTFGVQPGGMFAELGSLNTYLFAQYKVMELCHVEHHRLRNPDHGPMVDALTKLSAELWGVVVGIYKSPRRHELLADIKRWTWTYVLGTIDEADQVLKRSPLAQGEIYEWALEARNLCAPPPQ